jgi:hypothetical protein
MMMTSLQRVSPNLTNIFIHSPRYWDTANADIPGQVKSVEKDKVYADIVKPL